MDLSLLILEMGCGSGYLAQYLNSFKYIGVDLSRNLVKEIKDQQEKNDLINIKKKPPKWSLGRETLYEPKKC